MPKNSSHFDGPAYYSLREAASILCVDRDKISQAIRRGTLPVVRRRSGLAVSALALRRLLGGAP
jgi:hypothetical protein